MSRVEKQQEALSMETLTSSRSGLGGAATATAAGAEVGAAVEAEDSKALASAQATTVKGG